MGRISRSFDLMNASFRILMQDKELMLLPLISGVLTIAVSASFLFGMGWTNEAEVIAATEEPMARWVALLWYVATYTIGIFFQAAVVAGASERLAGGDPTIGSSLRAASKRLPAIVTWGVIAGTIGLLIRSIQDRSELVGKIVMGLIGVVWSFATFFMVPVLVMEDDGVGASFKRSWATFKKTWGESVAGEIGLGFAGFALTLPVIAAVVILLVNEWVLAAMIVGALGFSLVAMFMNALHGIWIASLYRYATTDEVADGFDRALYDDAFRPKR